MARVGPPDGKKLLLLGGFGAPAMSALNRTTLQLFSVSLSRAEHNPDDRDVDTEAQAQATIEAAVADGGEGGAAAPVVVKIEWDGLDRRIRQLTNMPGSVGNIAPSPDSRTIAFVAQGGGEAGGAGAGGGPTLYTIGDDGTRLTVVAQGNAGGGGGGRGGGGGFGGGYGDHAMDARQPQSLFHARRRNLFRRHRGCRPQMKMRRLQPQQAGAVVVADAVEEMQAQLQPRQQPQRPRGPAPRNVHRAHGN